MLITQSRKQAVRYYKHFERYINKHNLLDELNILIAFSGEVVDDGGSYKENQMNGFRDTEIPSRFRDDYNYLIVAEKYQTGFDEPLLHTMFVDKKLRGVKAVQTLSRLNRKAPEKKDTLVIDFVNSTEDIYEAFLPYYEDTKLDEGADFEVIYSLQDRIQAKNIYRRDLIEIFIELYKQTDQEPDLLGKLQSRVFEPVTDKYLSLSEDSQYDFRVTAQKLVKMYDYIGQLIKINDRDLHEEIIFLRYLDRFLPRPGQNEDFDLKGKIRMEYYEIKKIRGLNLNWRRE